MLTQRSRGSLVLSRVRLQSSSYAVLTGVSSFLQNVHMLGLAPAIMGHVNNDTGVFGDLWEEKSMLSCWTRRLTRLEDCADLLLMDMALTDYVL